MRKVSSCLLRLQVCDVIQFRDDHARMRIRGPLSPSSILVPRAAILLASATDRELWKGPILQSAIRGLPVNCAAASFRERGVERKWLTKGVLIYFTKL